MMSIRSCDSLSKISYGVMPGSRFGTLARSISTPVPPRLAVSQVEQVSPAAPMSWMPATASVASNSRQASSKQLLLERIADLHGRPIFARFLGQLARSEGGAGQTVAAGFRADVEDRIADAPGRAARELFVPQHAETENIDERIAFEALVEINLAADGRDADAIAVMRDAGDDAGEEPAVVP